MDIAELQATFDSLAAALRQAEAEQVSTGGTQRFWELQRQIGNLRLQSRLAEKELLAARIAGVAHDSPQARQWKNRLYFIGQELKPPQPVPPRTMVKWYSRFDTRHGG